jgi:hypothetical protein
MSSKVDVDNVFAKRERPSLVMQADIGFSRFIGFLTRWHVVVSPCSPNDQMPLPR